MEEITSRVKQGNAAIRKLNGILWSNHITQNTKIRICKESIAKYDAELSAINKNDAS